MYTPEVGNIMYSFGLSRNHKDAIYITDKPGRLNTTEIGNGKRKDESYCRRGYFINYPLYGNA